MDERERTWRAVLEVNSNQLTLANIRNGMSYEKLQKNGYEISRDGGKTWQRCEKPESV